MIGFIDIMVLESLFHITFFEGRSMLARKRLFKCLAVFSVFLTLLCGQTHATQEETSFYGAQQERPIVVVIASYNNADWYKQNLDSVFNQNYSNYRVVYVDDCSPDGTGDLVERYVKELGQEHRFTFIKNDVRKLKMANTYMAYHHHCKDHEIVVELDGDDWIAHNNVFAKLNKIYSNPDVWMTYGHFDEWPRSNPQIMAKIPQRFIDAGRVRKFPGCFWAGIRTYYGWLIKQVKLGDLLYNGSFLPFTSDAAIMFPMFDMSGNRFEFITDDMFLLHNVKTPLNDHKVDPRNISHKICYIMRDKPAYPLVQNPLINFINRFNGVCADVIVFSRDKDASEALSMSIEKYAKGVGNVITIKDGMQVSEFERLLADASDYVLLIKDDFVFEQHVDLNDSIKKLEETGGYCFFLGAGKDSSVLPSAYVNALDDSYAWQFKYGVDNWKKPNNLNATLYRTSDVVQWIKGIQVINRDSLEKSSKNSNLGDRVGLFYEESKVVDFVDETCGEKPMAVVVASYKNAEWYKRNLDSIFSQNYSNYRVIYVDDVSPDGTADLVEQYVKEMGQDHRFTLIRNTERTLKVGNFYKAVHNHCRDEEIIINLDGDDWLACDNVFSIVNDAYSDSDVWMTYGSLHMNYDGIIDILKATNITYHFDSNTRLLEIQCKIKESIFFDDVIHESEFNHIKNIIKRWKKSV